MIDCVKIACYTFRRSSWNVLLPAASSGRFPDEKEPGLLFVWIHLFQGLGILWKELERLNPFNKSHSLVVQPLNKSRPCPFTLPLNKDIGKLLDNMDKSKSRFIWVKSSTLDSWPSSSCMNAPPFLTVISSASHFWNTRGLDSSGCKLGSSKRQEC